MFFFIGVWLDGESAKKMWYTLAEDVSKGGFKRSSVRSERDKTSLQFRSCNDDGRAL